MKNVYFWQNNSSFNRTIVELKYLRLYHHQNFLISFNRTIVELKCCQGANNERTWTF